MTINSQQQGKAEKGIVHTMENYAAWKIILIIEENVEYNNNVFKSTGISNIYFFKLNYVLKGREIFKRIIL